jgi:penicillin-binding protein 1A
MAVRLHLYVGITMSEPSSQANPHRRLEVRRLLAAAVFVCAGVVGLRAIEALTNEADETAREFRMETGPQATLVYDRHKELVFSFSTEQRTDRVLEELATPLVPAVLAIEDRRFYRHRGIDLVRMAGALRANLEAGRIVQGGSTITQQLARLTALSSDKSYMRKIRETLLAMRIERRFAKREILEAYLNRVYLGDGYYGVEAAARGYFDKSASDLSASEAATLAGLIKCPSVCSPRVSHERARARRDLVLRAMVERDWLTQDAYIAATESPLTVVARGHDEFLARHTTDVPGQACELFFMDVVRRQLIQRFGEDRVYHDGLRVFTTIDPALQEAAESSIARRLAELGAMRQGREPSSRLEGSLVSLDVDSGEVLALVGGGNFHQSPFNRAVDAYRQPGSAFKPILFAAALEQGLTPGSVINDLDTPTITDSATWLPAGEHEAGSYTLRRAITVSSNRAAARLMQIVGLPITIDYARRLGITSRLPSVPSLALGTGEVTLMELTAAYRVFADGGRWTAPIVIRRVEDRWGEVLWENHQGSLRVLRSATAYLISSMLADVIDRGTASQARALGFSLPAAGKTGTSDDYADAWFVGYTPHLVTGVWFGFDQPAPIMRRGFAATVAVPAWVHFMRRATANQPPDTFEVPPDIERVTLCRASHLRATPECRLGHLSPSVAGSFDDTLVRAAAWEAGVYDELFMTGTAPEEYCPIHGAEPDIREEEPQPASSGVPSSGLSWSFSSIQH